ncbi:transglycosylase SLT domain-containing protein [Vibrio aphrogenes]|uniref:transglycosylase SLT domain-containing protein n=1 Tax=Vibrio aphrogenes TaxID=1891186 RepID=UPI000B350658|nr:transglycosylase SLT domain-containing protein [Vibrio aphrogenes]
MLNFKKTLIFCAVSTSAILSLPAVNAQAISSTQVNTSDSDSSDKPRSPLEIQRQVYEKGQDLLDAGDVAGYQVIRPQIASYPLTPYIDYRVYLTDIENRQPQEVNAFTEKYQTFPFSSRVRANYLDALAKNKQWKTLLEYQQEEPRDQRYRCYYYYAKWTQGQKDAAYQGAKDLWLTGSSVSSACDDLFDQWTQAGLRTETLILERMLLSFKSGHSGMFRYLDGLLTSDNAKASSKDLQALYRDPSKVGEFSKKAKVTPFNQQLTEYAFRQLIRKNTQQAVELYEQVVQAQKLPLTAQVDLSNYASAWLMNTDSSSLAQWRDSMLNKQGLPSRVERRARIAIQNADWKDLAHWISKLPAEDQQSLRWQYWSARVEMAQGKTKQAKQRLQPLLGQRNFYSAAAAELLGEPIRYQSKMLNEKLPDIKAKQAALDRIQEMINVDKISAAKSEWRWLLWHSTQSEKKALVQYAAEKHWHHFTVVATIEAKMWDYTSLRFPIAHRWWFDFYSKKNDVPLITLMSLARQESALDVEARSPVGARGIMQIMPTTAKHTADVYDLKYQHADELYNVQKNIEIGSSYLGGLLDDFNHNRIFAFAAYNAGPHRVKVWRARSNQKIDAYSFIEAIPFDETRGYVQNILMFETYYRNLLGQEGAFLTPQEVKEKY